MLGIFGIVLALIAGLLRLMHARPGLVIWLIIAAVILIGVHSLLVRPLTWPWNRGPQ